MRRLRALGRYDAEDREVRTVDQFQYFTWLVIVGCIVGMAMWVHSIAGNVTGVGKRVHAAQRRLNAEAHRLGAERTQLITGCQRINRVLAAVNTTSAGNYTLFHFIVHLTPPSALGHRQLERAVSSQSWTPKTNCTRLVDAEGAHYSLPNPIPFGRQFPPPSQLLHPWK